MSQTRQACVIQVSMMSWSSLFCSSFRKSKPTWLHPVDLQFEAKKYFCSINIDRNNYTKPAGGNTCTFSGQLTSLLGVPFNLLFAWLCCPHPTPFPQPSFCQLFLWMYDMKFKLVLFVIVLYIMTTDLYFGHRGIYLFGMSVMASFWFPQFMASPYFCTYVFGVALWPVW